MEVTLKQASLVSVNDSTIIVKKDGMNYTYKNASVKSVVDGNIILEVNIPYKKGDYLRVRIYGDVWVTLVYKEYDHNKNKLSFFVSENDGSYRHDSNWFRDLTRESEDVRYATPAEILELKVLLHSWGKYWNVETLELENYFWKPRVGQAYYYVSASARVHNTINDGCPADKDIIAIGNCFKTEKEAEQYLDKFKEVFKR